MLQYADVLLDAYSKGSLIRGNCKRCAVGTILKSRLGYEDSKWWEVMIAFAQGTETTEDELYALYLERLTGLTMYDLWQIDGAFEGTPYEPGKDRPATDEDLIDRLDRVLDVLEEIKQPISV